MDKENMSNLAPYLPLLATGKLHLYGKAQAVDKRKMGHVNVLGNTEKVLEAINQTKIWSEAECIK